MCLSFTPWDEFLALPPELYAATQSILLGSFRSGPFCQWATWRTFPVGSFLLSMDVGFVYPIVLRWSCTLEGAFLLGQRFAFQVIQLCCFSVATVARCNLDRNPCHLPISSDDGCIGDCGCVCMLLAVDALRVPTSPGMGGFARLLAKETH